MKHPPIEALKLKRNSPLFRQTLVQMKHPPIEALKLVTVISFNNDIVIIAGPDNENKTFIFYFEEFPSRPVIDTLFGRVELGLPACFD